MSLRVFHCCQGTSHKFWSITAEGNALTVRFGRIATAGQTRTKPFATSEEAEQAAKKLISQKLRKGYVEVAPEEARRALAKKRAPQRSYQQLRLPF